MEASLTSPSGKTEMCEISDLPQHLYDIKFKPAEEGVHTVSLKHRGLHIAGKHVTLAAITGTTILGPYRQVSATNFGQP